MSMAESLKILLSLQRSEDACKKHSRIKSIVTAPSKSFIDIHGDIID